MNFNEKITSDCDCMQHVLDRLRENGCDDRSIAVVEGMLDGAKLVRDTVNPNRGHPNIEQYPEFAEQIRKELVRDNAYLQIYLQDEEEWDTRQPTLDEAKECLLNDENNFIEFLTESSMRKYTYNLLREIVGEII